MADQPLFRDGGEAGKRLSQALEKYCTEEHLVLAIPRGGTGIGNRVAKHPEADFSFLIAGKLLSPTTLEPGLGR
jgi:putative phosphoribosyl transferase